MIVHDKPPTVASFSCLLLGHRRTGKTSFVKRLLTGEFVKHYVPSKESKLYTLWFDTNYGRIEYHVRDMPSMDLANESKPDCVIIMEDIVSTKSLNQVPLFDGSLSYYFGCLPVVLCGNKMDLKYWNRELWRLKTMPMDKFFYVGLSVKTSVNIAKPFVLLARELLGHSDLELIAQPAIMPPIDLSMEIEDLSTDVEPPAESDDDW
ncbi:hypothetical protein KR222_009328 [Zaprionus bogoriensis]|nr:hypothetical protein KR222_009328 [Zaprionus bogoriensis]